MRKTCPFLSKVMPSDNYGTYHLHEIYCIEERCMAWDVGTKFNYGDSTEWHIAPHCKLIEKGE